MVVVVEAGGDVERGILAGGVGRQGWGGVVAEREGEVKRAACKVGRW